MASSPLLGVLEACFPLLRVLVDPIRRHHESDRARASISFFPGRWELFLFGYHPLTGSLFFVSFMIVNAVMLTNVALAVLLEKVIEDPDAGNEEEAKKEESSVPEGSSSPSDKKKKGSKRDSVDKGKQQRRSVDESNSPTDRVLPFNDGGGDPNGWLPTDLDACDTPSPSQITMKVLSSSPRGENGNGAIMSSSAVIERLAATVEKLSESVGEMRGEMAAMREQQGELLRRLDAR